VLALEEMVELERDSLIPPKNPGSIFEGTFKQDERRKLRVIKRKEEIFIFPHSPQKLE
jgi:hypothetical protein